MKTITEDGEVLDEVTHEIIARAPPFWKTPFNHDTDAEVHAGALICRDPSKTQQQFAKDADINSILAKFMQGGELPLTGSPIYQDAEKEFDLQDAIVTRSDVEAAWELLPAAARNILKDPRTFMEYVDHCMKTGDLDPLREIGLALPKEPPEPLKPATPTGDSPAPVSPDLAPPGAK